jgi:predicted amidohydrolase
MRVTAVQLSSQADVDQNLSRVVHWVERAAREGSELIVLPENFAFFGDEERKREVAEDLSAPGPVTRTLSELARRLGVFLVGGGMPERSSDPEKPYNTSVLFDREGALLAAYRKVHLFDVSLADGTELRESRATSAGSTPSVTALGAPRVEGTPKLGMTVCYDLRFPELFRALGALGATVVTVPAAFTLTTGKDHWHVLLRARAIENQTFVVAAAQHGSHPRGRRTYGKSLVVDPWGDVLAQAGEGEGLASATLDFSYLMKVRAELPCLTHRRF